MTKKSTTKTNNEKNAENTLGIRRMRINFLRTLFIIGVTLSAIGFIIALAFGLIKSSKNTQKEIIKGDNLILEKPTFIGHSDKGGEIVVTAEDAQKPIGDDKGSIILKKPHVKTQSGSQIDADSGIWNQVSQELILNENVRMSYSNGDVATSKSAFYGRNSRTAISGEIINDTIVALKDDVTITRKSGEILLSNGATWNDTLGLLKLGAAANLPKALNGNNQNNFATIKISNGQANSKALEINANNEIIYGSGGVNLTFGKISASANTYEFHSKTKRIILRGQAHASFYK